MIKWYKKCVNQIITQLMLKFCHTGKNDVPKHCARRQRLRFFILKWWWEKRRFNPDDTEMRSYNIIRFWIAIDIISELSSAKTVLHVVYFTGNTTIFFPIEHPDIIQPSLDRRTVFQNLRFAFRSSVDNNRNLILNILHDPFTGNRSCIIMM